MNQPRISLIAVMAENRVIGKAGKIPWHISEDLKRFKKLTEGHLVIMGRKTFESLLGYYQRSGRSLPKRINIIVTKDKKYVEFISKNHVTDAFVAHSMEEAINLAKKNEEEEIYISGGAQIYDQGIDYAEKLYLTIVKGNFEGDAYFPDYSQFKKVILKKESSEGNYKYTFLELER